MIFEVDDGLEEVGDALVGVSVLNGCEFGVFVTGTTKRIV